MAEPALQMSIGDIDLDLLPPREAVTFSGGGRPITERTALDGSTIIQRGRPVSRRLTVTAPQGFAIRTEHADAIYALARAGAIFTLTLKGYVLNGVYRGCMFVDLPSFPPTADPRFKSYSFTLYIP